MPDGRGVFVGDLAAVQSIRAPQVSCANLDNTLSDPIDTTTAGASGLHFDPIGMQFIYNWKTDRLMSTKCFVLILILADGRSYQANFRFPK